MNFPVEFNIFGHVVAAHAILEASGYAVGAWVFGKLRGKFAGPDIGDERGLWIILACLVGALMGAKLLALIGVVMALLQRWNPIFVIGTAIILLALWTILVCQRRIAFILGVLNMICLVYLSIMTICGWK